MSGSSVHVPRRSTWNHPQLQVIGTHYILYALSPQRASGLNVRRNVTGLQMLCTGPRLQTPSWTLAQKINAVTGDYKTPKYSSRRRVCCMSWNTTPFIGAWAKYVSGHAICSKK